MQPRCVSLLNFSVVNRLAQAVSKCPVPNGCRSLATWDEPDPQQQQEGELPKRSERHNSSTQEHQQHQQQQQQQQQQQAPQATSSHQNASSIRSSTGKAPPPVVPGVSYPTYTMHPNHHDIRNPNRQREPSFGSLQSNKRENFRSGILTTASARPGQLGRKLQTLLQQNPGESVSVSGVGPMPVTNAIRALAYATAGVESSQPGKTVVAQLLSMLREDQDTQGHLTRMYLAAHVIDVPSGGYESAPASAADENNSSQQPRSQGGDGRSGSSKNSKPSRCRGNMHPTFHTSSNGNLPMEAQRNWIISKLVNHGPVTLSAFGSWHLTRSLGIVVQLRGFFKKKGFGDIAIQVETEQLWLPRKNRDHTRQQAAAEEELERHLHSHQEKSQQQADQNKQQQQLNQLHQRQEQQDQQRLRKPGSSLLFSRGPSAAQRLQQGNGTSHSGDGSPPSPLKHPHTSSHGTQRDYNSEADQDSEEQEGEGEGDGKLVAWHMFHIHIMRCALKDPTRLLPGPVPPELLVDAYKGNIQRDGWDDRARPSSMNVESGPDVEKPPSLY